MSFGKIPYDLATKNFRKYLRSNDKRLLSHDHRVIEGLYRAKDGHKVPILIHGNTLPDENGRKTGHVDFVTDLTEQNRSLIKTGDVQRNLMPQPPPRIKGLEIEGNSVSCDEIGGEYYDFIETNADKTAATILN